MGKNEASFSAQHFGSAHTPNRCHENPFGSAKDATVSSPGTVLSCLLQTQRRTQSCLFPFFPEVETLKCLNLCGCFKP